MLYGTTFFGDKQLPAAMFLQKLYSMTIFNDFSCFVYWGPAIFPFMARPEFSTFCKKCIVFVNSPYKIVETTRLSFANR